MRTLRRSKDCFALSVREKKSHRVYIALTLSIGLLGAHRAASAQSCSEDSFARYPLSGRSKVQDSATLSMDLLESSAANQEQQPQDSRGPSGHNAGEPTGKTAVEKISRHLPRPDFNRNIFYRNKLEFALDVGWLPINVPFPFDVFEGDPYDLYPLRYTLVPVVASLRWHVDDPWGPPVIRGNWDVTFSFSATAIPRGPETHYFSYDMGLRRNFIPRNWRVTPYWDVRAGVGYINAKGPLGVYYAQGQNFTFTINMGAGARYNLSRRYGISAGLNWMHLSNGNLSSPGYSNYGINVYGPVVGLDIQLRPRKGHSE